MKFLSAITVALFALLVAGCGKTSGFDPTSNPDQALEQAIREVQTNGKKVLIIAGGDWCSWSRAMESLVSKDKDIKNALNKNFVTIKVYFGEKNRNTSFFSKLPPTNVHPFFWVVSKDGEVLKAVDPSILEDGKNSYNKEKFLKLITDLNNI